MPSPHFSRTEVFEDMKKSLLLFVVLAVCATARAQGTPGAAQVPSGKIAVVYSRAFQDPKTGISRYAATIGKLDAEFKPLQDELNQTAQRLKTLQDEIRKMQQGTTPATPQQIQAKIDQFDDQKKAYDRKGEDAKNNYGRRRATLMEPLQADVEKALGAFAVARGITMVLDGSQIPLVYASDNIDITRAFIADYNAKNPATASAATPR